MIGEIPRDRRLKEIKLDNDSIMVSGPIEILKTLKRIDTAPVNMALLNKDEGALNIQAIPLDPRVKFEENMKIKMLYKTKKVVIKE
jgi:YbbR domain-containing protein